MHRKKGFKAMPVWISNFFRTAIISLTPLLVSAALLLVLVICAWLVVYFMGVVRLCRKAVDLYLKNHGQS